MQTAPASASQKPDKPRPDMDRPDMGRPDVNRPDADRTDADRSDSAAPFAPGWWLRHLRLTDFRNYKTAELQLDGRPVVLTGPNGAGKTNLLEAVSLLAPGRGLRRAGREELPRSLPAELPAKLPESESGTGPAEAASPFSGPQLLWSVSAGLVTPQSEHQLGTGLLADDSRRSVRIDEAPATQSDLGACLAISWLTPQMDGLFAGSPSGRRRFIDRLAIAFDPAHAGRLARYERALRERGRLLAEGRADAVWLASLESLLAETGVAIMATRAALIADMNAEAETSGGPFPSAWLEMTGGMAEQVGQMPALELEDRLRQAAAVARQAGDAAMPGPQASDMLAWDKVASQPASRASTGEQKALLISLVLAHARLQGRRLGRPPILLLDDVAAHLDDMRRQALFDICGCLDGQIWFTGTDRTDFAPLEGTARFLEIAAGRIVWPAGC